MGRIRMRLNIHNDTNLFHAMVGKIVYMVRNESVEQSAHGVIRRMHVNLHRFFWLDV